MKYLSDFIREYRYSTCEEIEDILARIVEEQDQRISNLEKRLELIETLLLENGIIHEIQS